ncbi:deoxyribose-phosphate aldolase [Psittacicella gerlachiana]|uniref:Deoxyribose-phosphate aldolase n=1 Tax=Psittacicella gerlachiana TaxID=2028574 RepID=A0A3A1YLZ3_9GAMM|nr:deoxyribose-phosphate aldolase [Psittacicella gerlachiana]RIY38685.1 deoxyribose-phosphate aldolase [Psittacicella gerlachiana]
MSSELTLQEQALLVMSLTDLTSLDDKDNFNSIQDLCSKAINPYQHTAAVCVYKEFAAYAKYLLNNQVKVATVINFPDGALDFTRFTFEYAYALSQQVDEIDYVFPWRKLIELTQDQEYEFKDLSQVTNNSAYQEMREIMQKYLQPLCNNQNTKIKVILESGSLTPLQIAIASQICLDYGVDFIKTSTGKHGEGAKLTDAEIIFKLIKLNQSKTGFKASGGIKTVAQAMEYINLGAKILGQDFIAPQTFRFGASGIYKDIISILTHGKSISSQELGQASSY